MIGVGDQVVCVNDSDPPQSDAPYVIKGRTYTVSHIEWRMWPVMSTPEVTIMGKVPFIWVAELPMSKTGHYGFRFRKVEKKGEEQKTDISVFKKMLDKTPETVK